MRTFVVVGCVLIIALGGVGIAAVAGAAGGSGLTEASTAVTTNGEIDVTLSPSDEVRPGEQLRVEATLDGEPLADATVTAGEATARTDADGVAFVPAPYERSAEISVESGDATGTASIAVTGELVALIQGELAAGAPWTVTATVDDEPVENATVTNGVETVRTDADGQATIPAPYTERGEVNIERGDFSDRVPVFGIDTDGGAVEVDDPVPGTDATVRATVGEFPMRNAAVTRENETVGQTDTDGEASVEIPYEEHVTIAAERGEVRGQQTVEIPTNATLETEGWAAPGGAITLRATVEDEPVPDATVTANGEVVGTTDANGEATVDVPVFVAALDLHVERGAAAGSHRIGGIWVYWALLGGIVVTGTVLSVARWAVRRSGNDRTEPPVGEAARRFLATLLHRARSLPAAILAALNQDAGEETDGTEPDDEQLPPRVGPLSSVDSAGDNDVVRAWQALTSGLEATDRPPSEVVERAGECGFPTKSAAELAELFQAVRYGDAEATAEREARAREALEKIRAANPAVEGDGQN